MKPIVAPLVEMRRFSYLVWLRFLNIASGPPTSQFRPQENVEVLPLLQRENRVRGMFAFCPDLVSTKKIYYFCLKWSCIRVNLWKFGTSLCYHSIIGRANPTELQKISPSLIGLGFRGNRLTFTTNQSSLVHAQPYHRGTLVALQTIFGIA